MTCTNFSDKFEKLVHLVGFIIRIYHDARSSECQIWRLLWNTIHKYVFQCYRKVSIVLMFLTMLDGDAATEKAAVAQF